MQLLLEYRAASNRRLGHALDNIGARARYRIIFVSKGKAA